MSNLVGRFKIVIPSLTVKSLSNSVVDEKKKQERRKRKECIALYGTDCMMTPVKKPRCLKSELVVVPVAELMMMNSTTPCCRVSDSPPEVVLQQALFLDGKCYSVKDDDSCVSSLSSKSLTFYEFTPSSSSITKAVTPTDSEQADDCTQEGKKENGHDETDVDKDAADGENKCHAGQEETKDEKNDKSVDEEIKRDADDLLYATRNAKYDLTMKVIECKKQDPNCVITNEEFTKMILDSLSKYKLPVLTLLNVDDVFTTIQDNEEFMTSQEKEIMLANQYPVRNELWGESDEYKRAFRIEKAKAANEITRLIYEKMVNRSGDITKHISMKEFRDIVHHVRTTHDLPDDMVFDKKYFNRRIKQNRLYIDPYLQGNSYVVRARDDLSYY